MPESLVQLEGHARVAELLSKAHALDWRHLQTERGQGTNQKH